MGTYIYIYMYVHIYIYVYVCVCICMHIYRCILMYVRIDKHELATGLVFTYYDSESVN